MSEEDKPWSTSPGHNRFTTFLYLREIEGGQLFPVLPRGRKTAHHKIKLIIEYPTYFEEFQTKDSCTRFVEGFGIFHINYHAIEEWRVRRCLISWTMHESFPDYYEPLVRQKNLLVDESLAQWSKLPPLVRKSITTIINTALGPI